ncbi:MAG: hypothetical protein R6V35_04130 [Candidatus Nanohaloarchaea archaeon]
MNLKHELYLAAYNANPFSRGKIKEKGNQYIWTDGPNEAYNRQELERLGISNRTSRILEELNDSEDSLATITDSHLENRYAGSD